MIGAQAIGRGHNPRKGIYQNELKGQNALRKKNLDRQRMN